MKCTSCGAEIPAGSAACEFCGSTPDKAALQSRSAIFEQIKRSPEYERRNSPERLAALPKFPAVAKVFMVVFPLVFIGASAFITVMVLGMGGLFGLVGVRVGGPMGSGLSLVPLLGALCPASFVVLGVFLMVHFRKKFRQFQQSPVLARPAVLVSKRTAVSGGSGDSSASTSYYLTAELEDGTRQEFQAMTPGLFGRTTERDAGILFTRATMALDFDRIVV